MPRCLPAQLHRDPRVPLLLPGLLGSNPGKPWPRLRSQASNRPELGLSDPTAQSALSVNASLCPGARLLFASQRMCALYKAVTAEDMQDKLTRESFLHSIGSRVLKEIR